MSLFAKKLRLGHPTRTDVEIISMPFSGAKPKPGDVVKLTADGKVEVTTTNSERAYGVVSFYDNQNVCAVVTHGHVIANLTSPTVGAVTFGILDVVQKVDSLDENGTATSNGYEVKVG